MKIVICNGQNHKGSTYHIGKGRTQSVLRWISQLIVHEDLMEV